MYISSLGVASACCLQCSKSKDGEEKNAWKREMFSHLDEAVQKAKEDSDLDSFDFDEMDRLLAAFFEICRECSKCDGSSQLVHALLDKEWINPFELSILQSIELRKEEVGQEIAREERKSKIPSMVKAEGNLRKPDPSLWGKKR